MLIKLSLYSALLNNRRNGIVIHRRDATSLQNDETFCSLLPICFDFSYVFNCTLEMKLNCILRHSIV